MKFNQDLAAIHGYLCADGYVIRNPPTQKHIYYYIGLRNRNKTLLKDFQSKFENVFKIKPRIVADGRCVIQNKTIYFMLTKKFSYYSDEWSIPELSKEELKYWLRAYFDCDGWVEVKKGKTRIIGLESVNLAGLKQIKNILSKKFNICSSDVKKRKNRKIWRLCICGKDDLIKFKENIDFSHPDKRNRLLEAINSYKTYEWDIPNKKDMLLKFLEQRGRIRELAKEVRFLSILKNNLINLKNKLEQYNVPSKIYGPWINSLGRSYYCLVIKQKDLVKIKGR